MIPAQSVYRGTFLSDAVAGLVVFLVALPLCLGVALASNAPLFSGILAGIVGGIVVGLLSGSHTSVSGPAAGLTAIVAAQIALLGSFDTFLLAVVIAGVIQIGMGIARAGILSAFFPTSVIKGLLAAIGAILILKQIPHLLGRDTDPEGEMSFVQPDHENTFSEFGELLGGIHPGAAAIGLASFALLMFWDRCRPLKKSVVPSALVVVLLGVGLSQLFHLIGGALLIEGNHLVQVPVSENLAGFFGFLRLPDFSQWSNPAVYTAGLTIAIVATLETLLNLEAVDKLDPQQRESPASRELVAQGIGNLIVGLIGGIPVTSVIVRSSVNINAGGKTRLAAVIHGMLLVVCVMFLPTVLNLIPLSCLAAILLATGIKLISPQLIREMWREGRYQFVPFIVTLVSIVLTDLVIGVTIGLAVSIAFILNSNLRRPLRRIVEKHLGDEVLRIELASQVSFLNRAALERALRSAPRGTHILLDAHNTDYIDPDILSLIREFKEQTAPVLGVQVSLRGFRDRYHLHDEIQFVDYSTRDLQDKLSSTQVLQILREGNERFRTGRQLTRDLSRQVLVTAPGQHPLAVVLSCIDSRTPAELLFDLGLGDIFSIRMAGNVTSSKVLGSMEYGCAVAGAKLILVMGHTRCGAVTAAVELACTHNNAELATGCQHLQPIVEDIQQSIEAATCDRVRSANPTEKNAVVDQVARRNVEREMARIVEESDTIRWLVEANRVAVVGAMYDVATGEIEFFEGPHRN
ncbi:bifunctional SulP family inorganic anion transporter/carbonic anhydrase [Planctellipticum variicoloris]|uniref:bifunctional SulP family inorganic anion transporter/carbonic anhydrase n=1 Tax=Planctellipticum variicoloris TaxID=3064265 RepID=UPI0030139D12|nr:SulP family inorganic anion transporter [Planctomycetaceae bacterium SH412]